MLIPWPSEEWIARWIEDLNASKTFRAAALGWEGTFGSVIRAHPPKLTSDIHLCFEVSNGKFTRFAYGCAQQDWDLQFVVEAGYETWKRFIHQELDPVKAVVLGEVRIRGNAIKALRFARPTYEMIRVTAGIPTSFST
jgi:putative sterol carrier protein